MGRFATMSHIKINLMNQLAAEMNQPTAGTDEIAANCSTALQYPDLGYWSPGQMTSRAFSPTHTPHPNLWLSSVPTSITTLINDIPWLKRKSHIRETSQGVLFT